MLETIAFWLVVVAWGLAAFCYFATALFLLWFFVTDKPSSNPHDPGPM